MRVKIRLHMLWVMLLLGTLLSYNLDLECVLADHGTGCQTVCQESAEDSCADPVMGSPPVIALPTRPFVYQAFLAEIFLYTAEPVEAHPYTDQTWFRSVGLRAPPLSLLV